ncbi:MAG: FHA domain-containing protein [Vulcanimicrobiota bacterium]
MSAFTLIAVDPDGNRREFPLQTAEYVVGREPGDEVSHGIAVPGDRHLSRQHFHLNVEPDAVQISRAERGRNPLFFKGEQCDTFTLKPGQVFFTGKTQFGVVLGRGSSGATHFTLAHKAREKARLRRLEDCFSAVLELLGALRRETGTPAWQVAFPVLRTILPELKAVAFLQLHGDSGLYRVIDLDPPGAQLHISPEILIECARTGNTLTSISEEIEVEQAPDLTLNSASPWLIVTPVSGLETLYAIAASGTGTPDREALEERATLVDLVCEMVGHHIVIQQGSEYSNLLGVFGHHIGTLFKTSGALQLWAEPTTAPEVKEVLGHLLPVWGISQAISLHKKRGEKAHKELLTSWVKQPEASPQALKDCLLSLISYAYYSTPEPTFFPWTVDEEEVPKMSGLRTLPPLDDVPGIFDKTLALTVGLLEVLSNVRKYPAARGTGREDREDLSELPASEKVVRLQIELGEGSLSLRILQPVVTAPDGSIPRSRSLERIRALEQSLLGGLVGTHPEEVIGKTSVEHVVLVAHRWSYRYGQLLQDWRNTVGS